MKMEQDGKGLPTQHRVLACLSSAMSMAVKRRLIAVNLCRQIEIAPEKTPTRPIYDRQRILRFLAAVGDDRLAALWRIYVLVGLRRGEALALTWSHVNIVERTLRVERSLGVVDGRLIFGPPKSKSGVRTVAFDSECQRLLRSHRASQNAERLAIGSGLIRTSSLLTKTARHFDLSG